MKDMSVNYKKPYDCRIRNGVHQEYRCSWQAESPEQLLHHVESCHPNDFAQEPSCVIHNQLNLQLFNNTASLILAHRRLFWFVLYYNPSDRMLLTYLRCIGTDEDAGKYLSRIQFHAPDGRWSKSHDELTRSLSEVIDIQSDTMKMDFAAIREFMWGNCVRCTVEIVEK